ncbi:unnamed protein product [Mytilus coruscus]|uniref:BTB domain-containing protein n=1 Tax=Mytilus coruscus TaxID=42192 RepID=A0A6J8EA19_MYTCO|nr:unnamed protein product [Mytilus coruscus]
MALFTGISKCQILAEEKANLLSLDSEIEDFSSGYDSPEYSSDQDTKRNCSNRLQIDPSSDDSDFSSGESTTFDYSSSEDDEMCNDNDIDSIESMKVTSVQTLIDSIQYILSMPDLCDVMLFFVMFLKHSKEAMKQKKKTKHNQPDQSNRLTIIIDNYDADIFRTFLLFVHCGSIVMEPSTVTGLLCLATEFDIPDLRNACWEFIERCLSLQAFSSLLMKETVFYGDHKAAQKLRLKILRISTKTSSTSSTVLRDSRITEQDSSTSIETLV